MKTFATETETRLGLLQIRVPATFLTSGTQLHQLSRVTGKKYQLEDHLVRMILLHGAWHHAQVPQADLPHL